MVAVPGPIHVTSKAEAGYELLRERILSGELRPGDALSIDGLARELGVSKIPIREAITRLQAERLVEVVLHVGARVAPISVLEAEQIYPIRHVIGNLAMELAVATITDTDIAALERAQRKMEAATESGDMARIEPLNRQFHQRIAECSANPVLAQLHADLMARCSRFRAGVLLSRDRAEEVTREHRAILNALRTRDLAACLRFNREHSEAGAKDAVERMRRAEAEVKRGT